ncbi:MAG: molybdopterin molybdotransferase MoeA [Deltaproteobacteria bacterium]|nr:molybdopterin molybdotransferase MoeA [Deltaproteobacteria bacterium]
MESFFEVKRPDEVFEIIDRLIRPAGEETIPLIDALDRVLNRDMTAPEDLPGFFRSTMDGYAVKAKGTFGASEGLPALFQVTGEVFMGKAAGLIVKEGQAAKIPTGGMLPEGADSVVMKEYCHRLDEDTIEVGRTVSPLENIIGPADDFSRGAVFLKKGHRLRPQDVGVMAGFGIAEVPVFRKPRIAIISTGDEIVPITQVPLPGQVRDINQYTLAALCRKAGADPLLMGLCPDDFGALKGTMEKALAQADSIWISGGSSVGTRDLTLKAFESLPDFELLVHGISISPGKPTIIGRSGTKTVIGLPGHVTSTLVVAGVFMTRIISRLSGYTGLPRSWGADVEAELSRNIPSANGREDYVRAKLIETETGLMALPIFGKSGLISTLVDADGLIRIDMNTEGLYQGEKVKVMLFDYAEGGLR